MADMNDNYSRQIGELVAEVRSLGQRMDRHDEAARHADSKRDQQIEEIKKELDVLRDHMVETKGGRRVLFALLAAAMTIGGFIWEVVSRVVHFK